MNTEYTLHAASLKVNKDWKSNRFYFILNRSCLISTIINDVLG